LTETVAVDPARLAFGEWKEGVLSGEGALISAYSADRICEDKPIRQPFRHAGDLWVTVSIEACRPKEAPAQTVATAYRLVAAQLFKGEPTTYRERVNKDSGDSARSDPNGFYHGTTVKYGKTARVLCGPPTQFVANDDPARSTTAQSNKPEQLALF
jgi:hypothetical protein